MRTFAASIAVLMLAGLAHGSLVTFEVIYDPSTDPDPDAGSFEVYATVSGEGQAGLAGFSVLFGPEVVPGPYDAGTNPDGLRNLAPRATMADFDFDPIVPVGFQVAVAPTAAYPLFLAGGQDSTKGSAFMVYHVGELPGPANWPALPSGWVWLGGAPAPIAAPVLLGSGNYVGGVPTVVSANANVWVEEGNEDASVADDVEVEVKLVPEPATMALLGVGFAGLAVLRRRRRR